MNVLRKRALYVLILFFVGCVLMGSTVAWAAPMLWSYPNAHLLISEVYSQGSPGEGEGTEWIELYNPTGSDIENHGIQIIGTDGRVMDVATPTRVAVLGTPVYTPYPPIKSHCSLYLAHDANIFLSTFGQCPDFAVVGSVNCDNTRIIRDSTPIDDGDETLCLNLWDRYYTGTRTADAVGWGTGGDGYGGAFGCSIAENPIAFGIDSPIFGTASPGETYLRGSDSPNWIGPGAEGVETDGNPYSEELEEVWRLSRDIDVPWEGVESTCRLPTAVQLKQTPQATAVQSGGYVAVLVGILGLLTVALVFVWSKKDSTQL